MIESFVGIEQTVRELDKSHMLRSIRDFPDQWQGAREIAGKASISSPSIVIRHMLTCGMGGSGIGGSLLAALAYASSRVSIQGVKQYAPPAYAGEETLAVVTSYSGNTAEMIETYRMCRAYGCHMVGVTSGGKLAEMCQADGTDVVTVPGGLMPRAALGYTLVPLLEIARRTGVLDLPEDDLNEAHAVLVDIRSEHNDFQPSFAREIALSLRNRLPLIYGGPGIMSAVARRWSAQIQENAKTPSFNNVYPELNHNEVMGWERGALLDNVFFVELRDPDDHPDVKRRMDITRELTEPRAAGWLSIEPRGSSALARMMYAVHLGDWVSFYLAMLNGVDPTPIATIQKLKERLQPGG